MKLHIEQQLGLKRNFTTWMIKLSQARVATTINEFKSGLARYWAAHLDCYQYRFYYGAPEADYSLGRISLPLWVANGFNKK